MKKGFIRLVESDRVQNARTPKRAQSFLTTGFTLLELLVVIAIIGILSSVVMVALSNSKIKARDARRISDISQMQLALELYYSNYGSYPPTGTGGWVHSSEIGWTNVATSMSATLPVDPTNEALP